MPLSALTFVMLQISDVGWRPYDVWHLTWHHSWLDLTWCHTKSSHVAFNRQVTVAITHSAIRLSMFLTLFNTIFNSFHFSVFSSSRATFPTYEKWVRQCKQWIWPTDRTTNVDRPQGPFTHFGKFQVVVKLKVFTMYIICNASFDPLRFCTENLPV